VKNYLGMSLSLGKRNINWSSVPAATRATQVQYQGYSKVTEKRIYYNRVFEKGIEGKDAGVVFFLGGLPLVFGT